MGNADLASGARDNALRALKDRRLEARKAGRKDNSSLPAGSPMYYYCRLCGLVASVMSEGWDPRYERPESHCAPCRTALSSGALTAED